MKLEIIVLDKQTQKFKKILVSQARRLKKFLRKNGNIEVYVINSERMRRLNQMFRKKDKPTNVLSFKKPKKFPGKQLGEVYLDPVYIEKHKENLALMLVHGVLHILGYDHEKGGDRITMERKEKQLLSKL